MLKFWVLLCGVEHSETILRIGFAKLLLKKQKTAGEKQTGSPQDGLAQHSAWREATECITRVRCCYLHLSQLVV